MQISVNSNIGKRRSSNQDYADYFTNNYQQTLFVLCDGVGGNQAGDVASKLTTEYIGEAFVHLKKMLDVSSAQDWVDTIIHDVNDFIYDESQKESHLEGMSTTLVMVLLVKERLIIAHVGDSRAYKYYKEELTQLTEDHSLVNELIKSGEITYEEGLVHPIRNVVTQSIGGTSTVEFELTTIDINDVDLLMICSDGLTNMLSQEELVRLFNENQSDNDTFGQTLINEANRAGGLDNITVILVSEWESTEERGGGFR